MAPRSASRFVIILLLLFPTSSIDSASATEQEGDRCLQNAIQSFRELRRQNVKCSKAAKRVCNEAEDCACDRRIINCDNESARLKYFIVCLVTVAETDPACRIKASFEDGDVPDAELNAECFVE